MSATTTHTHLTPARRASFLARYPLLLLAGGLLLGVLGALAVVIPALNPPGGDVRLLILYMLATGGVTVLGSYLLTRLGLIHWFRSLRWTLLVTIVLTVILFFVNVWVTAQLMFISDHDLWLTTGLLVFAGLTAIAFGLFSASAMTARIHALSSAATQVARGDLEARVPVQGNDELAALASTFNWMASSLQQADADKRALEQARRDLLAGVSHDLRTPLTSMRAMIEALLDGVVDDPETVRRYLGGTQAEIQHLSRLIDDLFELARLDVGHPALAFEWSSLSDLLSDLVGGLHLPPDRAITLQTEVAPDLDPVYMAPDKIERVLYNLLDNAVRHTPPGGTITLTARRQADGITVAVHNTGSLIAVADQPLIFERFYRGGDASRSGSSGGRGTGLGLAIARGFVEAHGGVIRVTSTPAQGTTFTFSLPGHPGQP